MKIEQVSVDPAVTETLMFHVKLTNNENKNSNNDSGNNDVNEDLRK